MNERWRVALAGLVASLAIPFLIVESPAPAEGVETDGVVDAGDEAAAPADDLPAVTRADEVDDANATAAAVEFVVHTEVVSPDVASLAERAGRWTAARVEVVATGALDVTITPPPSNTNLALIPTVATTPVADPDTPEPEVEPDTPEPEAPAEEAPAEEPDDPAAEGAEPGAEAPVDPDAPVEGDPVAEVDPEPPVEVDNPAPVEPEPEPEPEPAPVDPDPERVPEEPPSNDGPAAPPQVDGRVPPPAGGPTAAQWDALRKCESTHNYRAISPSGLYRGAYQFSQQTWDWVSGIHWPHLVGVDPIDAEPAWQDVMAYTLYAMRGWDQWPICGRHLL